MPKVGIGEGRGMNVISRVAIGVGGSAIAMPGVGSGVGGGMSVMPGIGVCVGWSVTVMAGVTVTASDGVAVLAKGKTDRDTSEVKVGTVRRTGASTVGGILGAAVAWGSGAGTSATMATPA